MSGKGGLRTNKTLIYNLHCSLREADPSDCITSSQPQTKRTSCPPPHGKPQPINHHNMALSRVILAIFAACIVCVISADLRERAQEFEDAPLERQRRSSYGYSAPSYHRSSSYTYYPGYSRGYGGYGNGYGSGYGYGSYGYGGYGSGYGNGYGYGGGYGGYRSYH